MFALLLFIYWFFPDEVLNKVAEALVYEDSLEPAEAIVILGGSSTGSRIKTGARLFHKGYGKIMIFCGEEIYPEVYSHTLMKDLAIKLGIPEKKIISAKLDGEANTWTEGIVNLSLLQENNINSFILVTSAFHTNRAHMTYSNLVSGLGYSYKIYVYPAEDPIIPIKGWWKTRTGKKHIFLEYLSTLNFLIEH
jgi:uncharacterized SAM-binding protein YcdF (DUF218 family)